jgi:hypothetical protein
LHDMDLLHRCEWRGVQHAPHLPSPMKPWSGSLGAELRHEVAMVQRLAPGLPIVLPPGKPNTRPAIERAVGLLHKDGKRGMEFVRKTYHAFWCEGKDISDPSTLSLLAEGHLPNDHKADHRKTAQDWGSSHCVSHRGSARRLCPGRAREALLFNLGRD